MSELPPAIVLLGQGGLATAQRLRALYPQARLLGLATRVHGAGETYEHFGDTLRQLYRENTPIIALCAAGIVIRTLAPELLAKTAEPPVLALAEDGSAVVPLLGGLGGVNHMARCIAAHLAVAPAITTSGELRFGQCLLDPPEGYVLADLDQGKRFVADLLGGAAVRIEGPAPWLSDAPLSKAADARLAIHVSPHARPAAAHELLIHPRSVVLAVHHTAADLAPKVRALLEREGIAPAALGCVLAAPEAMADGALHALANALALPLRFNPALPGHASEGVALRVYPAPIDPDSLGQRRGRLAVVGLGPGAAALLAPAVRAELAHAQDVLGYETYVRMAGPFRDDQVLHCTDNREELQRARHAFELAAQGRSVVVVSSGDPGVFAMASAVLEALESGEAAWHRVDLQVLPGISASLATAAWAGAPLGHDFCVLSLSDNLKPWAMIEKRLHLACEADLAMAFYNPISRSRPWQLGRALEIVRQHRAPATPVVLGRDVARPGQRLRVVSLGELTPDMVDMRTMVLVGSSTTRCIARVEGPPWVYTPRWYPQAPHQ
ncbi:precorrin-3B C(17)-methyltransferase [Pseudomonas typographi]|uniref:Precorrin-3B C(17)-methyltransferase n=1 Tax=Pseudomonas typographi TaxID=2715964 RepID=A0ABR7Z7L1_9PSED|nr:precorrin-3B C(17)-methyltransferase [Pseudomonas typographi]MBD1554332.1 precorrin-3B C(17)-methyltransferase [Pseudomonas typographi]MBD1589396.1 precorrin-3B C(17)-methyltransferase [Pseudomonas typographi]MBD1601525.1 precorrin-3B C(17)-methyltransferase [Pseudomonas typographi]